jgi:hypothetical protein
MSFLSTLALVSLQYNPSFWSSLTSFAIHPLLESRQRSEKDWFETMSILAFLNSLVVREIQGPSTKQSLED